MRSQRTIPARASSMVAARSEELDILEGHGQVLNEGSSRQPTSVPATWPAFAARLIELITESWDNVFRLCVFLLALSVVGFAWWWLHGLIW